MTTQDLEVRRGETFALQEEYTKVFEHYLPSELRRRQEPVRVISVGCDLALEFKALRQFFPQMYIEGIDNRGFSLEGARVYNRDLPSERFREADARDINSFGK